MVRGKLVPIPSIYNGCNPRPHKVDKMRFRLGNTDQCDLKIAPNTFESEPQMVCCIYDVNMMVTYLVSLGSASCLVRF